MPVLGAISESLQFANESSLAAGSMTTGIYSYITITDEMGEMLVVG
jgi:hypothetical protein